MKWLDWAVATGLTVLVMLLGLLVAEEETGFTKCTYEVFEAHCELPYLGPVVELAGQVFLRLVFMPFLLVVPVAALGYALVRLVMGMYRRGDPGRRAHPVVEVVYAGALLFSILFTLLLFGVI